MLKNFSWSWSLRDKNVNIRDSWGCICLVGKSWTEEWGSNWHWRASWEKRDWEKWGAAQGREVKSLARRTKSEKGRWRQKWRWSRKEAEIEVSGIGCSGKENRQGKQSWLENGQGGWGRRCQVGPELELSGVCAGHRIDSSRSVQTCLWFVNGLKCWASWLASSNGVPTPLSILIPATMWSAFWLWDVFCVAL